MKLHNAGVVITGAGSGIGAALARRFHSEGARLVLCDLNAEAVQQVAGELEAYPVVGDAVGEHGVGELVTTAQAQLGAIDLYCANAGVARGAGVQAQEEDWEQSWETNVMGAVRAARTLVPQWIERGAGRMLITASAAGLLSMVGSPTYSATKHAAVGFAEWLSMSYRHRGVTVQCLCPEGVRTPMLTETTGAARAVLQPHSITAEQVADLVVRKLDTADFLITPHEETASRFAARAADPDAWLAGMNRLQRKLEDSYGMEFDSREET